MYRNINYAIYFYNIKNKLKENHDAITKAFDGNYTIDNKHMTDYMQSMNKYIVIKI